MRIVCQKCAAAYAIDDRLISARGVRGQCPRCRHQQLVKQGDPTQGASPLPIVTPLETPRIPPEAFKEGPLPPPRAPATSMPPAVRPVTAERPPLGSPAPTEPVDDALLTGAQDPAEARCRSCGARVSDVFDQALGICEACRARTGDPKVETVPGPAPEPLPAADEAPVAEPPSQLRGAPLLAPGVLSAHRGGARDGTGGRRAAVLAAVALALLGVAGAGGWSRERLVALVRPPEVPVTQDRTTTEVVARWEAALGTVEGSAEGHLEAGHRLLTEDRAGSYQEAAVHFQKALVLDPTSDRAIAGYVTALALGRDERLGQQGYDEAQALVSAAKARSRNAPRLLVAHAHLLLTRPRQGGHQDQARELAASALERAEDVEVRAAAHLAAGRAAQLTSSALAEQSFNAALALDPDLKIARYLRALARERVFDYAGAVRDLERRLEAEPGHWASLEALTRILQATGSPQRARTLLQQAQARAPDDARPRLRLAVLAYQSGGAPAEALRELRGMAARLSELEPAVQRDVLVHLAAAERGSGSPEQAAAAANRALQPFPGDPAAHLQLLLLALDQGRTAAAATHLTAVDGKLDDPALERLLEGRVRVLQERWEDAEAAFQKSVAADDRRTDARLWAGAAAAAAGKRAAALQYLQGAALADPWRVSPTPGDERLFIRPRELLRHAEEPLKLLGGGPDDLLPWLYDGVLRFHQGDYAAAARHAGRVVEVTPGHALAQAWQALAASRLKDLATGRKAADRAAEAGRQLALAHFARGVVLAQDGKLPEARRSLTATLQLDRGLLGAEVELAQLELAARDPQSAQARLRRVVTLDPSYAEARALLFGATKGDATR
jgi:predicted Zn finger-like uncharacterized protein